MKVYYAGEIPTERSKVGLFLGGITNLGNSWRSYLLEILASKCESFDLDVFVPEPRDQTILTWGDFMKTMPVGFSQIAWERDQSEYCSLWTMFLPTYANRYDSGPHFATPSANPRFFYPKAVKCLEACLESGKITQEEYRIELERLTMANIGCQVRFEAGYLVGRNHCKVIWGKVYNSLQISFGPYLEKTGDKMHVLEKDDLSRGVLLPPSFVDELISEIQKSQNFSS